jgi:hypothetical protein
MTKSLHHIDLFILATGPYPISMFFFQVWKPWSSRALFSRVKASYVLLLLFLSNSSSGSISWSRRDPIRSGGRCERKRKKNCHRCQKTTFRTSCCSSHSGITSCCQNKSYSSSSFAVFSRAVARPARSQLQQSRTFNVYCKNK